MWEVKGKDNTVKATVNSLEYNGEWMGERYVSVSIESPSPIDFKIGDYIVYRGERFELNYDPGKIKCAPPYKKGDAFKYSNIKFNSFADELTRCDFLDYVIGDNQLHFVGLPKFRFYGGIRDLAKRIQANLDKTYSKDKWSVVVSEDYTGTEEKNISIDNQKVSGVLGIINKDFKTCYTIIGRTLTIGAAPLPADAFLTYGKGNGLYEIEQNAEADQAIVTRLRAYGSTRNLPHRYYHRTGKKIKLSVVEDKGSTYSGPSSGYTRYEVKFTTDYQMPAGSYEVVIGIDTFNALVTPAGVVDIYYQSNQGRVFNYGHRMAIFSTKRITFLVDETPVGIPASAVTSAEVPPNLAVNNLMLPGFPDANSDVYIDSPNISALGTREGTIYFDGSQEGLEEIYPSIEGMTAQSLKDAGQLCNSTGALDEIVSATQIEDDGVGTISDNEDKTTPETAQFKVYLKDLGFDINEQIIVGNTEKPTISFKSGKLGGREFEIKKCETQKNADGLTSGYILTLDRVYDEDVKLWYPYKDYNAGTGDKFVLLYIAMPDVYIKAASQRLLVAAKEWLSKNDYSRSVYAPKIDEIFMARQHDAAMASGGTLISLHDTLREGMLLMFEDADLNINASITIDKLVIKENVKGVPEYEVTLKEEKSVGRLDKLQNQIDSIVSGNGAGGGGNGVGGYTAAQIQAMIRAYGGTIFLSKLRDDRTKYRLSSDRGFEVGKFEEKASGGWFGATTEGRSQLEVDELYVRVKAFFEELTLVKATAQAGEQWTTPGGGVKLTSAKALTDSDGKLTGYSCGYLAEQDGEKFDLTLQAHDWVVCKSFETQREGAAAIAETTETQASQTLHQVENHYFCRLITWVNPDIFTEWTNDAGEIKELNPRQNPGVGWRETGRKFGYFNLSVNEGVYADPLSDAPMAGDEVVQRGNLTKPTRQGAICLSTVGANAPTITIYAGINSYDISDKAQIQLGYDATLKHAYLHVYGDAYIGARDESTYFSFDENTQKAKFKGIVEMEGTGSQIGGQSFEDWLASFGYDAAISDALTAANNAQNTADGAQDSANNAQSAANSAQTAADNARAAIEAYEYLKAATNQGTLINGGLVLTSVIQTGYTTADKGWLPMAGLSGLIDPNFATAGVPSGRAIAAWFGGARQDRFDPKSDYRRSEEWCVANRAANALIRMDGSAYFSQGMVGFRNDGSGWLCNDNIKWTAQGALTIGSGVIINVGNNKTLQESLTSIANFQLGLTNIFTPLGYTESSPSTLTEIPWSIAGQTTNGELNCKAVRVNVGIFSTKFVSCNGMETSGAGSGSGGGLIKSVYGWSEMGTASVTDGQKDNTFNAYAIQKLYESVISVTGRMDSLEGSALTGVSKEMVESALNGSVDAKATDAAHADMADTANTATSATTAGLANWATTASKSEKLTTARFIFGNSFDGTANIGSEGDRKSLYFVEDINMSGRLSMTGIDSYNAIQIMQGGLTIGKTDPSALGYGAINIRPNTGANTTTTLINVTKSGYDFQCTDAANKSHRTFDMAIDANGFLIFNFGGERKFTFTNSGSLGIAGGLEAVSAVLDGLMVNGPTECEEISSKSIDATGTIHASVGIWTDGYMSCRGQQTTSDERLKTELRSVTLTTREIADAPKIYFTWKDSGELDCGTYAQYWERLIPPLVRENERGDKTLSYDKAALLSAITNAGEIERLKKENEEMREELKEMRVMMQELLDRERRRK